MGKKVYIQFMSGLGNQMFQYAFMKECQERGRNVRADLSWYQHAANQKVRFELSEVFPHATLPQSSAFSLAMARLLMNLKKVGKHIMRKQKLAFEEKEYSTYEEAIFQNTSGILQGYWQTEKYFQHVGDKVRRDFQFEIHDNGLKELAEEIKATPHSVAVHIRRGDYMDAADVYGGICTEAYYEKAMENIQEKYPDAIFYFFTDDVAYAKEKYQGSQYRFLDTSKCENYQNWYDLYLMSRCEHNIIANSSFSWWGAWLNDNPQKMVIAPGKWLNTAPTPDVWCEGWIKI